MALSPTFQARHGVFRRETEPVSRPESPSKVGDKGEIHGSGPLFPVDNLQVVGISNQITMVELLWVYVVSTLACDSLTPRFCAGNLHLSRHGPDMAFEMRQSVLLAGLLVDICKYRHIRPTIGLGNLSCAVRL
ncbi:uncharacterized protein N7483_005733 [Penicillium malachiteum]|uniref:uncharacterized protein n=1 Tax=Penicillium malachiteum TaxID=1324776 RepID=UPI002547E1B9|nr:uncharacterized protein N7483_005733 [Penicillium malachiteum]KAJ5731225.1 hypothetical protein N7483_005733 [Penicillium malachiteum]